MATKKSNTTTAPKAKTMTKAMLEKSLNSTMAEVEALGLNFAQAKESRDLLAVQVEKATMSHMQEVAVLQEKIMMLEFEVERKNGLLKYIQDKFKSFMQDWKDLRGKPWKRFWRAVGLLGDIMDIMTTIMNKIDDDQNWGGDSVN